MTSIPAWFSNEKLYNSPSTIGGCYEICYLQKSRMEEKEVVKYVYRIADEHIDMSKRRFIIKDDSGENAIVQIKKVMYRGG